MSAETAGPGQLGASQAGRPGRRRRGTARRWPRTPGVAKPDAIFVADDVVRSFGGLRGGRRRPPRGPARHDHLADRPQRRREVDLLQPRLPASTGPTAGRGPSRGEDVSGRVGLPDRPAGHGPDLPAHQGADPAHRAARTSCSARRASSASGSCQRSCGSPWRSQEQEVGAAGRRAPRAVQPRPHARRVRRDDVRGSAQAPRDGPGPHGRARR